MLTDFHFFVIRLELGMAKQNGINEKKTIRTKVAETSQAKCFHNYEFHRMFRGGISLVQLFAPGIE